MYTMLAIAEQFPNIAFSKASGSLHYVLHKYYKEVSFIVRRLIVRREVIIFVMSDM